MVGDVKTTKKEYLIFALISACIISIAAIYSMNGEKKKNAIQLFFNPGNIIEINDENFKYKILVVTDPFCDLSINRVEVLPIISFEDVSKYLVLSDSHVTIKEKVNILV